MSAKFPTLLPIIIYPLRLIQLGSIIITSYVICFLLYMHDKHRCKRWGCSPSRESTSTPISEVILLIASIITLFDFFLFLAPLILRAHKMESRCHRAVVDSFTQLSCTAFSLFVYSIAFVSFASTPVVRDTWPYCVNVWDNDIFAPPERYFCIVTQSGVSSGLVTWIATVLICLCAVVEVRKDRGVGAIRLGGSDHNGEERDGEEIRTLLGQEIEEGVNRDEDVLA
ncbi:hypothetical protein QBC43DRAFT_324792 [Cladorrhinum sp. PSN259]|nr:hypothetical protein QBC43DRAFT_324792 [Cladorrhinum sp. PSN259]